jgi:hypothetical protein
MQREALLDSLAGYLDRGSRGWTACLAVLIYAYFLAAVMPEQSAQSRSYAGDWGGPDRHLVYTPDEFYGQVATWGAAGRAQYVDFRLGLDIGFALAYGAFLVTLTSLALRAAFPFDRRRRRWNLVALVPVTCDLLENALGIALVQAYPQRLDVLAWLASGITLLKWTSLVVAHLVLAYALLRAAAAWWRRRRA